MTESSPAHPKPNWFESAWGPSLLALGLSFICLILFYWTPISGAVSIWSNISTYNHCFLIIPISCYLLWENRAELAASSPQPWWPGLIALLLFNLLWLIAASARIAEGEHIAIVGMIQAIILTILGPDIFKRNWLAFLYLWLLVPTGTFLIPFLRDLALIQTNFWLSLTDIPVFTEGYMIEAPFGLYLIAPGCAGMNFFLSALALTPLYAFLIYQTWMKRILAVLLMLVIAIIANAIRIFIIIALAEWTGKQIDIVDDHLLYGWGFFVIILFVMGWIGLKFADPEPIKDHANKQASSPSGIMNSLPTFSAVILMIISTSLYAENSLNPTRPGGTLKITEPHISDWRISMTSSLWEPSFPNADDEKLLTYEKEDEAVTLYLAYYWRQSEGQELIAGENIIVDPSRWRIQQRKSQRVKLSIGEIEIEETLINNNLEQRLIWHSYWVDGDFISGSLKTKLTQAKAALLGGESRSAIIALSTPIDAGADRARARLSQFLENGESLTEALSNASYGNSEHGMRGQ